VGWLPIKLLLRLQLADYVHVHAALPCNEQIKTGDALLQSARGQPQVQYQN
jgi:hypothetical protein